MKKTEIFTLGSPYREDLKITGYTFGQGQKSACIVGSIRGNEVQQLYVCSQIVRKLEELEAAGKITKDKEILVIPSINHHAMNIGKRFWPVDNTDINRMFPGYDLGETTQRIAAGVFEKVKNYDYRRLHSPCPYDGYRKAEHQPGRAFRPSLCSHKKTQAH